MNAPVLNIIAHVLLMGRGAYDTPKDWAIAMLKRLDHEGYAIVPKAQQYPGWLLAVSKQETAE